MELRFWCRSDQSGVAQFTADAGGPELALMGVQLCGGRTQHRLPGGGPPPFLRRGRTAAAIGGLLTLQLVVVLVRSGSLRADS